MPWNWELPDWPRFTFDSDRLIQIERQFLLEVGSMLAYLKTIDEQEYNLFVVEILSSEGQESFKIEGEILDRESLQSSIKQHFGLPTKQKRGQEKESRMAQLLCNVYESFHKPLTHEMLWQWHSLLFRDISSITDNGKYRTHREPMQIVSNRYGSQKIFFEAPPSEQVYQEMSAFIDWFNSSDIYQNKLKKMSSSKEQTDSQVCSSISQSILGKAAIAHVYFESIHPFEDGNGRIGRVLSEKILSQSIGRPVLIAISKTLEKRKKEYYSALERCNRTLSVQHFVEFFAEVAEEARKESMDLLQFLIEKSKMLHALSPLLNKRQEKALLRMFEEGPNGFKGGLSAENYISITKTTRATATRDLTDLVEKGALQKSGELRHTRYRLNLSWHKIAI